MKFEELDETDLEDLYDEMTNWQRVLERHDCGHELHGHIGERKNLVATILALRHGSDVS